MCENCQKKRLPEVGNRRRKLWELERSLSCPVVGNCLTIEELQKPGRQCNLDVPGLTTDYYIHRYFVQEANAQGLVSRKMHKFLDRKYANTIKRFAKAKTGDEIEQLWQESSVRGDLTGPFWALATHPYASADLLDRVYGEIHMLSHLVSRTSRSVIRQVRDQEKVIQEQRESHQRERQRMQERLDEKSDECNQLLEELRQFRGRGLGDQNAVAKMEVTIGHLQAQLESTLRIAEKNAERATRLEFQRKDQKREIEALEQKNGEQSSSLERMTEELNLAELSIVRAEQQESPAACSGCDGESMSLCGRCVLYVGGRSGIKQHYREVVEKNHGNFIHHDGGQEDSCKRLHGDVLRADAVFCPVDCVSHTAALSIKALCKRHGKQLVMLRSSGLTSLVKGLQEIQPC